MFTVLKRVVCRFAIVEFEEADSITMLLGSVSVVRVHRFPGVDYWGGGGCGHQKISIPSGDIQKTTVILIPHLPLPKKLTESIYLFWGRGCPLITRKGEHSLISKIHLLVWGIEVVILMAEMTSLYERNLSPDYAAPVVANSRNQKNKNVDSIVLEHLLFLSRKIP